jgi:hypothetical protein
VGDGFLHQPDAARRVGSLSAGSGIIITTQE